MGGAVTNICNTSTVGDTDGVLRILSLVERVNIFNEVIAMCFVISFSTGDSMTHFILIKTG